MHELCEKCLPNDAVLVCGDFNQPRMRWSLIEDCVQCDSLRLPAASSTLLDGMDYLCLHQRNLICNSLNRTLDLVFCTPNCEAVVHNCSVPLLPVDSHHPPLEIILPIPAVCEESVESRNERPLNFRKIDFAALSQYLTTIDWNAILPNDVDEMAESFCSILNNWLTANVPRIRPPRSPAWGTHRLSELKRTRNTCQRNLRRFRNPGNHKKFQLASKAYRLMNSCLYKSYVLRVQISLTRNPRDFWRFIDSKRKCPVIPKNVYFNETTSADVTHSC